MPAVLAVRAFTLATTTIAATTILTTVATTSQPKPAAALAQPSAALAQPATTIAVVTAADAAAAEPAGVR